MGLDAKCDGVLLTLVKYASERERHKIPTNKSLSNPSSLFHSLKRGEEEDQNEREKRGC